MFQKRRESNMQEVQQTPSSITWKSSTRRQIIMKLLKDKDLKAARSNLACKRVLSKINSSLNYAGRHF